MTADDRTDVHDGDIRFRMTGEDLLLHLLRLFQAVAVSYQDLVVDVFLPVFLPHRRTAAV